jgi:hypothetical protein
MTGRLVALRPSTAELVDAGFLMALTMIAIIGLNTTFTNARYLLLAAAGAALGLVIAHFTNVLRWHWLVVVGLAAVVYIAVGMAVHLQDQAARGDPIAPLDALTSAGQIVITGWKDLLTTYPPVSGDGPYVALPYLLAVVVGSFGFVIARRTRAVWAALVMPTLLLAMVILIGTYEPAALIPQGLGFAVLAFGWAAVRHARRRKRIGKSATSITQVSVVAGILAVALAGAAVLGPYLPGTNHQREVLRRYVVPPVQLPSHTSPLAGFRNFSAETDTSYHDDELLKVEGDLSPGYLRFAVLDYYNGITMDATAGRRGGGGSASTGYQQMGSQIPSDVAGNEVQVLITVQKAYAENADLSMWVPSPGIPKQIGFQGNNAATHATSLLFNLSTGQGLVTDRLQEGDQIGIAAVPVQAIDLQHEEVPGGAPIIDSAGYGFAEAQWSALTNSNSTDWDQLVQLADKLRDGAFWSDGSKSGEEEYRPGHGQNRLLQMLTDTAIIGSDEQFAVLMALAANRLNFPARVVLGAELKDDGVVRGEDVCAWVELQVGDGEWKALLPSSFIPPRDQKWTKPPPPKVVTGTTSQVPPANPERAPSWLDVVVDPNQNIQVTENPWIENLIQMALWVVRIAGPPISLILLFIIVVVTAKAIRSQRRRGTGPLTTRIAGGWKELTDLARDMGYQVPAGATRREQSAAIGVEGLRAVAEAADQAVFSAGNPDQGQVTGFWLLVKAARKSMMKSVKFFKRWKTRLSLRSLVRAAK